MFFPLLDTWDSKRRLKVKSPGAAWETKMVCVHVCASRKMNGNITSFNGLWSCLPNENHRFIVSIMCILKCTYFYRAGCRGNSLRMFPGGAVIVIIASETCCFCKISWSPAFSPTCSLLENLLPHQLWYVDLLDVIVNLSTFVFRCICQVILRNG